jgi:hypothetical protein
MTVVRSDDGDPSYFNSSVKRYATKVARLAEDSCSFVTNVLAASEADVFSPA